MNIIVVEDNADLLENWLMFLRENSHEVLGAANAIELDQCLLRVTPDVLCLDVGLPGEDGLAIARRMSAMAGLAIILMSGRDGEKNRIHGLECGADHYMVKPVAPRELLAVLHRISERLRPTKPVCEPSWQLRCKDRLLISPQRVSVSLTENEVCLLRVMARQGSMAASRRKLIEALGGDSLTYDERRLEVMVSRMRKKIRETAGCEAPLRSEWGKGYSFTDICLLG